MRFVHILIAGTFFLFAVLQYNDPDYYLWVPAYAVIALLAFFAYRGQYYLRWTALFSLFFLIWFALYVPAMVAWARAGFPSITGEMKAVAPFVEAIREAIGLGLCVVAAVFYYFTAKKHQHA